MFAALTTEDAIVFGNSITPKPKYPIPIIETFTDKFWTLESNWLDYKYDNLKFLCVVGFLIVQSIKVTWTNNRFLVGIFSEILTDTLNRFLSYAWQSQNIGLSLRR